MVKVIVVAKSCLTLRPCGLQHVGPPCPSPSPGVCPSLCPLNQWCYLSISSPATLSFCLQFFLASEPFPLSQLFSSGGQSIGASLQHQSFQWICRTYFFRIEWFDLLAVKETHKSLLQHQSLKASILWNSAFLMVQLSHPYMTTGKTRALTRWTFVSNVIYFDICCLSLS